MAFKVGDKAKVVDKELILYNKTVELIDASNEAYIFNSENQKLKLVVHKDAIQNTIEWESSPDKAETNFDKLLGQNGELVEERKKQVLAGALGIVQRYCEETPNKMEVVAALFGKKLGEVFSVEYPERNRNFASCCYFKAAGLFCEDRGPCETMLNDLLTGKAVIIDE